MTKATSLDERIARLERENGLLKRFGGIVIIVFAVTVFAGAGFVGYTGWGYFDNGLTIKDSNGDRRLQAGADPKTDKAYLNLYNYDLKRVFYSGEDSQGYAIMSLNDSDGKRRIQMGVGENNNSYIQFYDSDGKVSKTIK